VRSKNRQSTTPSAEAAAMPPNQGGQFLSHSPGQTFELGERIGESLTGGELILLTGGLGAGKTLLTKGILNALDFDVDEVTSPSFALVNLYHAKIDVYHIDLWRIDSGDAAAAVGLDEILEDGEAVVIVEWAERLKKDLGPKAIKVTIKGDGDDPRQIEITENRYS
jgi:tRNA threonylcarbamoyladenosine biosynthesis protein TsaE